MPLEIFQAKLCVVFKVCKMKNEHISFLPLVEISINSLWCILEIIFMFMREINYSLSKRRIEVIFYSFLKIKATLDLIDYLI